jgi:hypothetical protein
MAHPPLTVDDLVDTIIKKIDHTISQVKEKEEENIIIRQYDTRMDYSTGFWDGFFYGSTLISGIMICAIYYFR